MFKRFGNGLWYVVTALFGIVFLLFAVFPDTLAWFGIKLSHETVVFGVCVFVATSLWFIFGDDRLTQKVSEIERTGPIALFIIGILVGIILEGAKLMTILQAAGFGMLDIVLMIAGLLAIVGGGAWAFINFKNKK